MHTVRSGEAWVGGAIAACLLFVLAWQLMALRYQQAIPAFRLTGAAFEGFVPALGGHPARTLTMPVSPIEPNICAFAPAVASVPVRLARLAHGYNMVDCMRIKGYTVALHEQVDFELPAAGAVPHQVWLLKTAGETSVWVTSMVRAGDFVALPMDTRTMPFPRVGTPDDPTWVPRGITWEGLKHPIRNLRLFLRSKWNASRCDWAVFLKLKRPAWASEDILTVVTTGITVAGDARVEDIADAVAGVHLDFYRQLASWWRGRVGAPLDGGAQVVRGQEVS